MARNNKQRRSRLLNNQSLILKSNEQTEIQSPIQKQSKSVSKTYRKQRKRIATIFINKERMNKVNTYDYSDQEDQKQEDQKQEDQKQEEQNKKQIEKNKKQIEDDWIYFEKCYGCGECLAYCYHAQDCQKEFFM
jgi:hypothetical protein